jgi:glycosyltransferase involved in cell wall biosynthesis
LEDFFKKPAQGTPKPPEPSNAGKTDTDSQKISKKKNFYQRRRKYFKKPKEAEQPRPRIPFKKISIVIPLLNEEESINPLANEIRKAVKPLEIGYEVIFVDDGSTDKSLSIIKEVCRTDRRFKYISFRKNYGKSAALQIGFQNITGDVVITMDADLQDDPNEIPNLISKLAEGFDLCSGWKKVRHDPFIKKYSSRFFNYVTRVFSGIKIHDFNCGLKAYRKEVIDNIKVYGELHRYIPVLAKWQGFTISEIPVKHHPRRYGQTKFGISRFFKGFIDLITVIFLTRYIKRPMHLFGFLGALAFIFGLIVNGYLTYLWFTGIPLSNRPMLFLGMLLIIVGVQFFSVGLLGEMFVHQILDEKEYVIKDKG